MIDAGFHIAKKSGKWEFVPHEAVVVISPEGDVHKWACKQFGDGIKRFRMAACVCGPPHKTQQKSEDPAINSEGYLDVLSLSGRDGMMEKLTKISLSKETLILRLKIKVCSGKQLEELCLFVNKCTNMRVLDLEGSLLRKRDKLVSLFEANANMLVVFYGVQMFAPHAIDDALFRELFERGFLGRVVWMRQNLFEMEHLWHKKVPMDMNTAVTEAHNKIFNGAKFEEV